jgi:hypothetical protein
MEAEVAIHFTGRASSLVSKSTRAQVLRLRCAPLRMTHHWHGLPLRDETSRARTSDSPQLVGSGVAEKDGVTVTVSRALLPQIETSPDGKKGWVKFTVDEART